MGEIKLYKDFETVVAPTGDLGDEGREIVVQYGFPGSGSTFAWQVLNHIFGDVKKTHVCPEYRTNFKVVATVRDFRDTLCTYFARVDLPPTREAIDLIVKKLAMTPLQDLKRVCEVWGDGDRILWLRYEDIVADFDFLFARLEQFFAITITAEQREHCRTAYSLDANAERSRQASVLSNAEKARGWLDKRWNQYTVDGINGLHITGRGRVGKWRTVIPADLHGYVNDILREPLERHRYLSPERRSG